MPRDLSLLKGTLAASVGLESVDTRLGAMADLAEDGDFDTLGDQVEELLSSGVYDIRPISYLLFDCFLESGFVALVDVLEILLLSCTTNFEAIGPEKKRGVNFDRRYTWLFEKLSQNMDYHELKRTPEWAAWHHGATPETFETLLEVAGRLGAAIVAVPLDGASRTLGHLTQRLRSRRDSLRIATEKPKGRGAAKVVPPVAPPLVPLDAAEPEAGIETSSNAEGHDADPGEVSSAPRHTRSDGEWVLPCDDLDVPHQQRALTVTVRFAELCGKLRAFQVLAERGDFEKAAVVCEDVFALVESFDPRQYFPEVFGEFTALMSKHALAVAEQLEARDGPVWKARVQHYRTNLKSFVER